MNPNISCSPVRQRGIVLVIGMIFLLVLTIIGVTSLRTTTLEQRMAGNMQQRTLAFQDAEARISVLLNDLNALQTSLSTNDVCNLSDLDPETNPSPINPDLISSHHTCPEYLGNSNPGRLTDTAEGGEIHLLHFRIESASTTVGKANATLQQGIYQRGPSPGYLEE